MRIRMNYYTDPDPGSRNSPYRSKSGSRFRIRIQGKKFNLNLVPQNSTYQTFAHLISKRIAIFLSKNERMRDSLKKISDSLIRSFLVSDLSDLLTIAHFL